MGRQALEAVARAADGRGPRTELTPLVLQHFSLRRGRRSSIGPAPMAIWSPPRS
jgi:hypothetical protein